MKIRKKCRRILKSGLKKVKRTFRFRNRLNNVEDIAQKRVFFRKIIDATGWNQKEAYDNIEYICKTKNASYSDVYREKLYNEFKKEKAAELKKFIDRGKAMTSVDPAVNDQEFKELCFSEKQKKAWDKIISGKITIDTLFDFMDLELPEKFKGDDTDYKDSIACRPHALGRKNIQICIRRVDVQPEIAREKETVCVIGLPGFQKEFEEAGLDFIACPDAKSYVVDLSSYRRRIQNAKVVAISGSLGKTTTTDMIGYILRPAMNMYKITKNQNTTWQICDFVYNIKPDTDVYVQEASGSFLGQLEKSSQILRPDIFVLTSIGHGHLENYYGKQELLLYEKLSIDRHASDDAVGIINKDDPLLKKAPFRHKITTFAIDDEDADFRGVAIKTDEENIYFDVLEKDGRRTPVTLNTIGRHNVKNALAAFAVGVMLGVDRSDIAKNLYNYRSEDYRQNLIQMKGQNVYVDVYSATLESLKTAMEVTRDYIVKEGSRKIVILADVPALGSKSKKSHRNIGKMVKEVGGADKVFFFGKEMREAYDKAKELGVACSQTADMEQLEEWLRNETSDGDFVCFKGSHKMFMHFAIDNLYGTAFSVMDEANAYAPTRIENGIEYKIITEYGCCVIESDKIDIADITKLTIEDEVCGENVRIIDKKAFAGSSIKTLHLPENLKSICAHAFSGCKDLTEVEMPSVQFIDEEAFSGCTSLEEIVIPENTETIGKRAFAGCINLKNVRLPEGIKTIAADAFEDTPCAGLSVPVKENR